MSNPDSATVFVVEDDPDWMTLVAGVLQRAGFAVERMALPEEILCRLPLPERGCVLLDLNLPGMTGVALHRELLRRGLALPVILMTAYGEVSVAVEAMRDGAFDFVEKPDLIQNVVPRVEAALAAHDRRQGQSHRAGAAAARIAALTLREREVLELIVGGLANKQIAGRLELSVKTVELHRAHVMQKTAASSLAELVRIALAAGIGSAAV